MEDTGREATEAAQADDERREQQAHLRLLAEQLPAVLWTVDDGLRFTSSFGAGLADLGLRPGDAVGLALPEFFRTDDPAHPSLAAHRRALSGEPVTYAEKWAGRAYQVYLEPLRGPTGAVDEVIGLALDVTEWAAAEERRRESDDRLRLALAAVGMGTWDYDLRTGEVACSPTTAALLGLPPGTERYPYAATLARMPPEDRARLEEADRRAIEEDADYEVEYRLGLPDGGTRWLAERGHVSERDPAGDALLMRGVITDVTERKRAEERQQASEAALAQAHRLAHLGSWEVELATGNLTWSAESARIFGFTPGSIGLTQDHFLARVHPADRRLLLDAASAATRRGEEYETEYRVVRLDGAERIIRTRGEAVRDAAGRPVGLRGTNQDVTEQRSAVSALRRSEARFRSLVQNASEVITILAPDGSVVYESPGIERVFGYAPDELVGENALALVHPDDAPRVGALFAEALANPGANIPVAFRFRHKDGSWRWLEGVGTNLLDDPSVGGIVVNSRDATERRSLEARLTHQAFHDELTGLPNRSLFLDRLEAAVGAGSRGRGNTIAVLFLDLDGFKLVNDSLGHAAGDDLLVTAARRLRSSLPAAALLARLGGDEFAVLLAGDDADEAVRVAERLLDVLRFPLAVGGREAFVTASVGIARRELRRADPGALLRDADTALYAAKAAGRGGFALFTPAMRKGVVARLEMETALRRAIEREELVLHFQPVVEMATGRIVGAEALLRWEHPERGLLPPAAFVGLAEETGLIVPLGGWVLRQACRQASAWQARMGADSPLVVGVNVSARQIQHPGFAQEAAAALADAGLDPARLELEVTEGIALADGQGTDRALRALRKLGVRLAIDDFGTGHSSLGRLRRLPFGTLKVDGSFVAGLGREAGDLAVVRAVTVLAHDLGLDVTAEGVETAEQVAMLRALGVDRAQGYYFAPPLETAAFGGLLASGGWLGGPPGGAANSA